MARAAKVLVRERIADAAVELLRARFKIELGFEMDGEELERRIGEFDGILIRSQTKLTAELIDRADRLKVIGRAGTGVDNVDVEAATRRGIVVANAPEANSIAAAEHTLALMLALCRNVPAAHASLVAGRWERSLFAGAELYGKTLGVIGFGRIGQLVARRALGFEMQVVGYDKFVSPERFRELGVEGMEDLDELYGRCDFVSLHLPSNPDTVDWIDAAALEAMKGGVRIVNCARGELIDLDALAAALESGKVAGAALDVFPEEPFSGHRILELPGVVVTPHLGASTAEAQDRAGVVTAEQVTAALTGGVVTTAVNIAAVRPDVMEALAPFIPLCEALGAIAYDLGDGTIGQVSVEVRGKLSDHDTRILSIAVLAGILRGHTEEPVNLVNAAHLADERGIELIETSEPVSEDFTELVSVTLGTGEDVIEVAGTGVGPRNDPYLVRLWGEDILLPVAEHLAVFRYHDQPGMIGKAGTRFGERGVNIVSAAVGTEPSGKRAVMALTTDGAVPDEVIGEILEDEGFFMGRAVNL